ncbi:antirestriction protein [Asticcacaulis excentricus]|uniref:Antirestriction protein n=1 Tax=Asticcacaulis excentricus (strain ATCC 15261 / DSM 4724 / KCTC 12464 / NCIMB 9791 / VKM B-1370 / CB 48) TaxID=573065 RepID=E8RVV0_ASTEC|nr:antirestriction protein [Asticcacaulis excentricus]ADU15372.1 Antirestriction protein [Asticcacaulis excentricus CB 48]
MSQALVAAVSPITLIPDEERGSFIPKLLPGVPLIMAENYIFDILSNLCRDYRGGLWNYYRTHNGALYSAPTGYGQMRLMCDGNFFDDEMSEDAAGIVATLFTLSHLSFRYPSDAIATNYEKLREFSYRHPESVLISRAID